MAASRLGLDDQPIYREGCRVCSRLVPVHMNPTKEGLESAVC